MIYISYVFVLMSIPNVAPGHLRSIKPPGMPKTIEFHQNRRFIRKATFMKINTLHLYV